MAQQMNNHIAKATKLKQLVELAMDDFDVQDVTMWRTQHVAMDLKAIWNKFEDYRSMVFDIKDRYEATMSPTNKSNLDGTISKLRADVKQHAINIGRAATFCTGAAIIPKEG